MKTHGNEEMINNGDNIYDDSNKTIRYKTVHNKSKASGCYYSPIVGEYIKDAVTGAQYPWKVGSKDETRFFRVTSTATTVDSSRKGEFNSYIGRDSKKAFYENPHVYMRHTHVELDEELVNQWYENYSKSYTS